MTNFNVIFAFFCGLVLIGIIMRNAISMETNVRKTAEEKELLLAELFHRVKNNLNLVTSLINIRKNKSNSQEVIDALEDCRSRVFSIALVHQKMYSGKQIGNLNLNDFLKELIYSIEHIFEDEADVKIVMEDEIQLPVSKAVPTGLILNEVLTNVYKHARTEGKRLEIEVKALKKENILEFIVEDNGPGIGIPDQQSEHLGLELIHSLSEQLEGRFSLQNKEIGTRATFTFAHY
jgi:two-component sensor histidine kinase